MTGVIWNGSGFIVSADGLILTNRHVAADAPKLKVIMSDGERMAKVIKIDDDQDLALIKIDPSPARSCRSSTSPRPTPPATAADIVVMGYPMPADWRHIKITAASSVPAPPAATAMCWSTPSKSRQQRWPMLDTVL